jgi:hypothetical protein
MWQYMSSWCSWRLFYDLSTNSREKLSIIVARVNNIGAAIGKKIPQESGYELEVDPQSATAGSATSGV